MGYYGKMIHVFHMASTKSVIHAFTIGLLPTNLGIVSNSFIKRRPRKQKSLLIKLPNLKQRIVFKLIQLIDKIWLQFACTFLFEFYFEEVRSPLFLVSSSSFLQKRFFMSLIFAIGLWSSCYFIWPHKYACFQVSLTAKIEKKKAAIEKKFF